MVWLRISAAFHMRQRRVHGFPGASCCGCRRAKDAIGGLDRSGWQVIGSSHLAYPPTILISALQNSNTHALTLGSFRCPTRRHPRAFEHCRIPLRNSWYDGMLATGFHCRCHSLPLPSHAWLKRLECRSPVLDVPRCRDVKLRGDSKVPSMPMP